MTKLAISITALIILAGCGIEPLAFDPLELRILKIVDIVPKSDDSIGINDKISVRFSRAVDPLSVNRSSFFAVRSEDLPEDLSKLKSTDGLNAISGTYLIFEGGTAIEYRPEAGFPGSGEYKVVITNKLCAEDGLNFNGAGNSGGLFTSRFYVNGDPEVNEGANGGSGANEGATGGLGSNESGKGTDSSGEGEVKDGNNKLPPPQYLVINEVYYDAVGPDTNGDLFIELYGEADGNLGGYYIAMVNGDDGVTYKTVPVTEGNFIGDDGIFVIADIGPDGNTNVNDADFLSNFDPQNGPDTIQLISPEAKLVDVVSYGAISIEFDKNGLSMYEGAPAKDAESGKSLSRIADSPDTNDNSADFVINNTPSPGSLLVQSAP